jgi:hypothetical protein
MIAQVTITAVGVLSLGLAAVSSGRGHPAEPLGRIATDSGAIRSTDRFAITSCSLGCITYGAHVTCGVIHVHENDEIRVGFSDEVDLSSVTPWAFRIYESSSAVPTPGSFQLDPVDASVIVFKPQLTFDPYGIPSFGFQAGGSYQIEIPGAALTPGAAHVLSMSGLPVWNRLVCSVVADQGLVDPVPGPPQLSPEVRVVVEHDGTRVITKAAPARGATRVALDSCITFNFHDLMNVGTVMTPVTGTSVSILVNRAPLVGGAPIPGAFSFSFDPDEYTTTVVFDPDQDLPPGETIYVNVLPVIYDLGWNPLAAEVFSFRTAGLHEQAGQCSAPARDGRSESQPQRMVSGEQPLDQLDS